MGVPKVVPMSITTNMAITIDMREKREYKNVNNIYTNNTISDIFNILIAHWSPESTLEI